MLATLRLGQAVPALLHRFGGHRRLGTDHVQIGRGEGYPGQRAGLGVEGHGRYFDRRHMRPRRSAGQTGRVELMGWPCEDFYAVETYVVEELSYDRLQQMAGNSSDPGRMWSDIRIAVDALDCVAQALPGLLLFPTSGLTEDMWQRAQDRKRAAVAQLWRTWDEGDRWDAFQTVTEYLLGLDADALERVLDGPGRDVERKHVLDALDALQARVRNIDNALKGRGNWPR